MAIQLVLANLAFYLYGNAYGWKIPVEAIDGWLAATALQIFIILRGLGRYLFPPINPKHDPQDRP